jgi:hypothetical protein
VGFLAGVLLGVDDDELLGVDVDPELVEDESEDDELDEDEEPEEEEFEFELEGGLFAKPVVDVVGVTFFLAFFVFFLFARADTYEVSPWLVAWNEIGFDWPTVVTFLFCASWFADVVGAGESDRRSGASAR